MRIESVELRSFRNHVETKAEPSEGLNLILGENAQGKTSFLESVFLCAFGRSQRTSKDAELIMNGSDFAYVNVVLSTRTGRRTVTMKLRRGQRKEILIDGRPAKRIGELMGVLNVVMFSPDDMVIVKGGPAERRRFMDMELSQMSPEYFYALQRYNEALKSRNALFSKELPTPDRDTLAAWDEVLAEAGGRLIRFRWQYMLTLAGHAARIHRELTDSGEALEADYYTCIDTRRVKTADRLLYDALKRAYSEDVRRGMTTVGPHRDDFGLKVNRLELREYGSQGQQRTAALALKLSEISILSSTRRDRPVLLLDDVLSELDGKRQAALLRSISLCQTILTTASPTGLSLDDFPDARVFECKEGKLCEQARAKQKKGIFLK